MKKIKGWMSKGLASVLSVSLLYSLSAEDVAASSTPIGPGITYESDRGSGANILKVDLTNEHNKLAVSVPSPLTKLQTTSEQARAATRDGHAVVGAINASFFDMDPNAKPLPFSIIAKDNEIISYGRISESRDHYRSEPILFGQMANGKALIGHYDASISATVGDKTVEINTMNTGARSDEAVLYTPSFPDSRTGTSRYGMEIIVEQASGDASRFSFGDELSGTVTEIRGYNDSGNSRIPENGFVIFANGDKFRQLQHVKEGDTITVSASINNRWQDAAILLGSGPQLVKDGEVNITMNPNSWRYKSTTARTAVGVDKTGDTVFMVTMDKANIRQLAEYMKKIGADRALNFDGGGSTTFVARQHGDKYATVMNRLSAGSERRVSSTLQAISIAPTSELSRLVLSREKQSVQEGETMNVSILYGMDEHYNPVNVNEEDITWSVDEHLGEMRGSTFVAKKAGEGRIRAHYQGKQVGSAPITVTKKAMFKDVNENTFGSSEIEYLAERNIIKGYPDGTYRPNQRLTRSQAASMLARAFELETENRPNPRYRDVKEDFHAYPEIAAVTDEGMMRGNGTLFSPNDYLTRAQMATILVRAFDLEGERKGVFNDVDSDYWAYDEIEILASHGIARGSNGNFRPGEAVTRAQFAVFLKRALSQ